MMRGRYLVLSLIALLISIPPSGRAYGSNAKVVCPGANHLQLMCLKANFNELYSGDYNRFFQILRSAETVALQCKKPIAVTDFLSVATLIKGNAEVQEYFAEVLENFAVGKTRCFLNGVIGTDSTSQQAVLGYLKHPIFVEREKINDAMLPFSKKNKFHSFIKGVLETGE